MFSAVYLRIIALAVLSAVLSALVLKMLSARTAEGTGNEEIESFSGSMRGGVVREVY